MCSSELLTRYLNKNDAILCNAGGHKLVHLQRHYPYPRRENGQARRGQLGRARLEAEPRRDLRARVCRNGGAEENGPERLSDCLIMCRNLNLST